MSPFTRSARLAVVLSLTVGVPSAWAVAMPQVTVGNAGNAADSQTMNDATTGYGDVAYAFRIAKHEVTAGQYAEFLNAVAATDQYLLYSEFMTNEWGCQIQRQGSPGSYTYSVAPDDANRPVNNVNFWDAARFANWLHNGRPATDVEDATTTEDGAYALNGYLGSGAGSVTRNPGAAFFLPTEDEWYKAAFHQGDGVTANYWDYPTGSDVAPINTLPDPGNHANYYDTFGAGNHGYTVGAPYYRTEAGAFTNSASPYGTFDQGGNVWEWNETVVAGSLRGLRRRLEYLLRRLGAARRELSASRRSVAAQS